MADFDRFRSFAERYVIERASSFRTGHEQEDAWTAILDSKTLYHQISEQAKYMDKPEQAPSQGVGAMQQAASNPYRGAVSVRLPQVVTTPPPQAALGLRGYVRTMLKGGTV